MDKIALDVMPLTAGTKLSHFEILSPIGEGGMGEVYRAHDAKLDRDVAIKVIRADALESSERRARFVREAKAAAVLNHPNVATVHEIDEAEGLTFIAMELIEGKKLSDLIASGNLSAGRAVAIAVDVAEGLSAAHEKNVVHRDLKPANIMILEDGRVKIIDFGLAKLLETGSEAETATKAQAMVGTVAYMSPEQARSGDVDHRSDIFSFGIVLYEMLAGCKPFEGPSAPETLNAIINTPTPRLPSQLSSFQQIVDRCLAKEKGSRFSSARDVAFALRRAGTSKTPSSSKAPWALVALAAAIVAAIVLSRYSNIPASAPRIANPALVTRAVGVEDYPAWSPDGEMLAYSGSTNPSLLTANWDVWVSQVRGEQPLNRTADHVGDDRYPIWSPDGRQFAFYSGRGEGGIYVMPALAGSARRLSATDSGPNRPQWSRDGKEIAYTVSGGKVIEVLTIETGESRRIAPIHSERVLDLAWSPDGSFFAFVHASAPLAQVTQVILLRVSDGEEIELTDWASNDWSPTWRDSRTLAYVSNRGGPRDLWIQRLTDDGKPAAEPEQMTTGVELLSASFTADGNKIAYSKGRRIANVWRVPLLEDRVATWNDAEQITYDQAFVEFLDVSPDGTQLAVSTDRSGVPDLWILPSSGGEMRSLTNDPTPDWHPTYSPDGTEIAFYAYRSGNRDVWMMPAEGGAARQLTAHVARDAYPVWSPDGTRIAFESLRSGSWDIWVLSLASGETERVTASPGSARIPTWSPDGEWVVYLSGGNFWRVRAGGGEPQSMGLTQGNYARFTPDGRHLLVTNIYDGAGNIWSIDPDTKSGRALTHLTGRPGGLGQLALATDGDYVYFTWIEDIGDIWVADVVDEG